jgi:hypothetical protein
VLARALLTPVILVSLTRKMGRCVRPRPAHRIPLILPAALMTYRENPAKTRLSTFYFYFLSFKKVSNSLPTEQVLTLKAFSTLLKATLFYS